MMTNCMFMKMHFLHNVPCCVAVCIMMAMASCGRPAGNGAEVDDGDTMALVASRDAYRDVYNQRHTEGCWVYAMMACIEHEAAMVGDTVVLSRQWLMARLLDEQASQRRRDGITRVDLRNVGREAMLLISRYGLVPLQQERSAINNSHVLQRKLTLLADGARTSRMDSTAFRSRLDDLLPRFSVVGQRSEFYYLSMRYTAMQFAESLLYRQRWTFYQCDPTQPTGREAPYRVADNQRHHIYNNVSAREMLRLTIASLRAGRAVYWEYGHKASRYDDGGGVSSDHAMAIVGLRGDSLLCLNSYGREWGSNGYCLVSQRYFLKHTSSIAVDLY